MHHIILQARAMLRSGFIALGMLAFAPGVPAMENSPPMPPEPQPAPWQQAGLEAALADPDYEVQYHALDYCIGKRWVAHFHFTPAQWQQWLGHAEPELQELAAKAAGQLGAQMPAEVQRTLARLRKTQSADISLRQTAARSLVRLGAGMIPEVQLELVAAFHETKPDYEVILQLCQALGQTGAAMTSATVDALLALMKNPETASAGSFAARALAQLGPHMPPQARELMLSLLLDARVDSGLRDTAAEAMGRLGPQMPPQAQQFLLSILRDPHAEERLRKAAPAALAQLGPQMPPEVQQALLAVYDEPPPAKENENAAKYHDMVHSELYHALREAGPGLPQALQVALLDRFLKAAHAPQQQPEQSVFAPGRRIAVPREELHILQKAGAQVSPIVIEALLTEWRSPATSDDMREGIAESFFQDLADHGVLPPHAQTTLLALLQDETASLDARGHAAVTLGHLGAQATPETKHALLMLLQKEHIHDSLLSSTAAAMEALGTHMPPEAAPVLVRIIRTAAAEAAAPAPPAAPDPFAPGESPPAATFDNYQPQPVEYAVPALGNLGDKLPPEAQQVLLEAVKHAMGNAQTPWHAALALARMGDKLPPQMQQSLLDLLHHPGIDYQTRLALRRTLGVCGIHSISDAQLADVLASTYLPSNSYDGAPDADLRTYLYLWLGRSPAHLQAVRWLAQTKADPPQSDTAPQQILTLITHLWPHTIQSGTGTESAAARIALRQQMARRTTQILTTQVKNRPLDEPTRQALRTLTPQLAADPAADCATALQHAQAALAADEKAR